MEPIEELKRDARTVRSQVSDLACEVGILVRQEIALARSEMAEKVRHAKDGAAHIGVGGALLHAAAFAFAAMCVVGLTLLFSMWVTPLTAALISTAIVGILLTVVGYALLKSGARDIGATSFVPYRTIESIKQDLRWAKGRLS